MKRYILVLMLSIMGLKAEYVYTVNIDGKDVQISKSEYIKMLKKQESERQEKIYYDNLIKEKTLVYKKLKRYFELEVNNEKKGDKSLIMAYGDDNEELVHTFYISKYKKEREFYEFYKSDKEYRIDYEIINIGLADEKQKEITKKFGTEIITVDELMIKSNISSEYNYFNHYNHNNNEFEMNKEFKKEIIDNGEQILKLKIKSTYLHNRKLNEKELILSKEEIDKIKEIIK